MSAPRLHVPLPLAPGIALALPPGAARHVQVLRLQPGDALTLFDGADDGEWSAEVLRMGRSDVDVRIGARVDVDRELPVRVTLALGMPANERMDALVEKATELGVSAIQPLVCERSVLRLSGERADKKVAHWQGVAIAASEQSGRTRVPRVAPVRTLAAWLQGASADASAPTAHFDAANHATAACYVLSLRTPAAHADAEPSRRDGDRPVVFLSGPEGGLSEAEERAARDAGFAPLSLGPRVLRADTAPLAALMRWQR